MIETATQTPATSHPAATNGPETAATYDTSRVVVLPQGNTLKSAMTVMRDLSTECRQFTETVERVSDMLISAAIDMIPTEDIQVQTPTGAKFAGSKHTTPVCGISILRAGASIENALRRVYQSVKPLGPLCFGKILIQRNEETSLPHFLYSKFPSKIESATVLILEPMLATGGSAAMAIEKLKTLGGVPEDKIIFVNILASRYGVAKLMTKFPQLRIVTAAIDEELTVPSNHISPGLGDFGDRFYGTVG
ncbi:uracil phosphoribosyltransferase [Microdochium trichocladiopsis]|uniref:uracil phosphoribosyltransferase n=1 Tax=Microdochium trichocladiopsis TaxID=1682393 RepID=A0A9P8YBW4_9PEZI|nr:uracil phosphoribosyltransferase [Microdochium trichocladiopsis]KAH7033479.1 uracil phosphoribosyltransferase [Microdochium trichocladiopsis]